MKSEREADLQTLETNANQFSVMVKRIVRLLRKVSAENEELKAEVAEIRRLLKTE